MLELTAASAITESLGSFGKMTVLENTENTLVSLSVPRDRLLISRKHVFRNYGLVLPKAEVLAISNDQVYTAFWMARGQWMLESPEILDPDWATTLASKDIGFTTEQTSAWVRLDLSGPSVASVFQRLTNIPSHCLLRSVVKRTSIHQLGVFLLCRRSCVSIYGPRSSADSLARAVMFALQTVNRLEKKKNEF